MKFIFLQFLDTIAGFARMYGEYISRLILKPLGTVQPLLLYDIFNMRQTQITDVKRVIHS